MKRRRKKRTKLGKAIRWKSEQTRKRHENPPKMKKKANKHRCYNHSRPPGATPYHHITYTPSSLKYMNDLHLCATKLFHSSVCLPQNHFNVESSVARELSLVCFSQNVLILSI